MTAPEAAAPSERGWRRVLVALIGLLVVPLVPLLRVIAPVEQTTTALVVVMAVMAVVGWRCGGRLSVALLWVVCAAWLLVIPRGVVMGDGLHPQVVPQTAYDWLWRGWVVLLAGAFGLASLASPRSRFLSRALSALGIAVTIAFLVAVTVPGGTRRISDAVLSEFNRRNDQSIAALHAVTMTPGWKDMLTRSPEVGRIAEESEAQLRGMPPYSATLIPALLALESLAVLAVGWSVYHRVARARLGPALGRLRDFRFNDQLIWGVAVGATLFLLPPFEEGRISGLNLLVFFGALYLIRGFGVLAWLSRRRTLIAVLVGATLFALPFMAVLAVTIGVGDTWMDWRSRLGPAA